MKRQAIVLSENVMGEILTENAHSAQIRYVLGGFEWTEWLAKDSYEEINLFDYEGDE